MAFYQQSKTAKAAVIGTILPWTGSISTIPDGWIVCDGQQLSASDFPLLAQTIGDTYNGGVSDFGGNFPDYTGSITIPNLNNRILLDIEDEYFNPTQLGGTGKPIDTDIDAKILLSPLIGDNVDNGVTTIFNDVFIDVVFDLTDRTGYSGRITGNTFVPGDGSQTLFVGPKKLNRQQVGRHSHPGSYETVAGVGSTEPGKGVVPYGDVIYTLFYHLVNVQETTNEAWFFGQTTGNVFETEAEAGSATADFRPGFFFGKDAGGTDFNLALFQTTQPGTPFTQPLSTYSQAVWSPITGADGQRRFLSGINQGAPGRVLAKVLTESPPVNITPRGVRFSPLSNDLLNPYLDSSSVINTGLGGSPVIIPQGFRNYYTLNEPASKVFISNPGTDFLSNDTNKFIVPHTHDEIEVVYDGSSLRARSSITVDVNIPANTTLDNVANRNALQIDFNVSQPSLTCLYIIRAY